MILGKKTIIQEYEAGRIHIKPFCPENVGPNSVDCTLAPLLKRIIPNYRGMVDPKREQIFQELSIPEEGLMLLPGQLYLGSTVEEIGSDYYVPMLEGRSSIGRLGLFVHVTAGFGDVGFKNRWTLEITPILPIRVYPGMRLCQVFFHQISDNSTLYSGRYSGQTEAEASRFDKS